MKKCKSCQTEIDDKAKKCPHCQADQRNWFAKHPILTVVIALIVIAIFGSSGGNGKSNTTTPTKPNENQLQSVKPEVTAEKVNATKFADEFDANQVAAETKWGGKLVELSAKVTNITESGLSFSDVGSKDFSLVSISCNIVDKQQLMSLKNGEIVTVRGVVDQQSLGTIEIDDCQVVK